jgi:hypothetical protein
MYRNARPVDLARWKYHFENGPAADVVEALCAYQNEDGGIGHAMEADSWNPNSTPLQCSTAVSVLTEIGCRDRDNPLVSGILRYLDSEADFVDGRWLNTVASNNDFPRAPWWSFDSSGSSRDEYNPTAILVGFVLEFAEKESGLYRKGLSIAQELAEQLRSAPTTDDHQLMCVVELLQAMGRTQLQDQFCLPPLFEIVRNQISELCRRNEGKWDGYCFRPSWFIKSPDNPFFEGNETILNEEFDYLLANRNPDGVWNIPWTWEDYDKEFAISENWWKAEGVIKNTLVLRAFGRIEP